MASDDPRVLRVVEIPGKMIVPNGSVEGTRKALGRPFSWSEWLNWEEVMVEPAFMGEEAKKLCAQIRDFANTKKIPGHS